MNRRPAFIACAGCYAPEPCRRQGRCLAVAIRPGSHEDVRERLGAAVRCGEEADELAIGNAPTLACGRYRLAMAIVSGVYVDLGGDLDNAEGGKDAAPDESTDA